MTRPVGRRTFVRTCGGTALALLGGCTRTESDEQTGTTRRDRTAVATSAGDAATETERVGTRTGETTAVPTPTGGRLQFAAFPDEAGDLVTAALSPTANCGHAVALVTNESEVERFDWDAAADGVREFAEETDYGEACLLAVRTTSPVTFDLEVDWVARDGPTTLRAHTTAVPVPGPSIGETETRVVRVSFDGSAPSRAVVVRTAGYSDESFSLATLDTECPNRRTTHES